MRSLSAGRAALVRHVHGVEPGGGLERARPRGAGVLPHAAGTEVEPAGIRLRQGDELLHRACATDGCTNQHERRRGDQRPRARNSFCGSYGQLRIEIRARQPATVGHQERVAVRRRLRRRLLCPRCRPRPRGSRSPPAGRGRAEMLADEARHDVVDCPRPRRRHEEAHGSTRPGLRQHRLRNEASVINMKKALIAPESSMFAG